LKKVRSAKWLNNPSVFYLDLTRRVVPKSHKGERVIMGEIDTVIELKLESLNTSGRYLRSNKSNSD